MPQAQVLKSIASFNLTRIMFLNNSAESDGGLSLRGKQMQICMC